MLTKSNVEEPGTVLTETMGWQVTITDHLSLMRALTGTYVCMYMMNLTGFKHTGALEYHVIRGLAAPAA